MTKSRVELTLAADNPPQDAAAEHFSGRAQVAGRFQREEPARVGGGIVTFAPGARTDWHSHPLGQTLIVTDGAGFVQEWEQPVKKISSGDTVWIPPEVKHWHGAGPDGPMSHVAIAERLHGLTATWMEKVSDQHYIQVTRPETT